jgi:DNA polymerase
MHSLPGSLDTLGDILSIPLDKRKLKEGKELVRLFCIPPIKTSKRKTFATRETHPDEWARFVTYAGVDIHAMRACVAKIPKWNMTPFELDLLELDWTINARGVLVDLEFCRAALAASDQEKARLAERTADITGGEVEAATQRDRLLAHLLEWYGVALPDMQGGTLERRVDDPDLPEPVRELLAIRLQASSTSVSKYNKFLACTSSDGRLRGTLMFAGALRTARWAGRLVQLHNMSRVPKYLKKLYDQAIDAIKAGAVDLLFANAMEVIGSTVRGALIARPGHKFVRADLSNIEGRALAWHAGEEWKVEAFAAGEDLYILGYSRSFGVPIAEVEEDEAAGGTMRLIGKVQELALGYQGAVGAFGSMAQLYGVNLDEERILEIVKAWRAANPRIVSFWYELEDAATQAVRNPGQTFECRRLRLRRDGAWLRIRLPSGRALCYPSPKWAPKTLKCKACEGFGFVKLIAEAEGLVEPARCDKCEGAGEVENPEGGLTYMGVDQYTRKWKRIKTYGGKLVENVTQATARDVLAESLLRIERAGYPICLHVHDEVIAEVPDTSEFTGAELGRLLATPPAWAPGLPLAAEGEELHRYRK